MIGIKMMSYETMALMIGDREIEISRKDLQSLASSATSALQWTPNDFAESILRCEQEKEDWEASGGDKDAYRVLRARRREMA